MRLLLDECIGDRSLSRSLVAAGHDVVRSIDEIGGSAEDTVVFAFARKSERVVMTYNSSDFKRLNCEYPVHSGLILIYRDNNSSDMNASKVVKALENVEKTHPEGITNQVIVLNAYRW